MHEWRVSLRRVCAFAPGVALLLWSSFMAVSAPRAEYLGADVLANSRGNNQASTIDTLSCDSLQGNPRCEVANAPCTTCTMPGYTIAKGAPGGYDKGIDGMGSCGSNWTGFCDGDLRCNKQTVGPVCAFPPSPPTLQGVVGD